MGLEVREIEDVLWEAIESLAKFITETTGQAPSQEEMARAIKRYFVLKEIKDHIEMERETRTDNQAT